MGWKLESEQGSVEINQTCVLGRDQFSGHANLSRKHFEISVKDGRCFLKDAGSTNGTFFRGEKLPPNRSVEIEPGEIFKAGDLKITFVDTGYAYQRAFVPAVGVTLLAVFAVMLNGPGMDHGMSIGLWNLFTAFTLVAAPIVAVGGAIWYFSPEGNWSKPRLGLSAVALFASGLVLSQVMFKMGDAIFGFHEGLSEARIDYYCISRFNAAGCINEIYLCPTCVARLPAPVRQGISVRIQPYIQQAAAAAAAEKNRKPTAAVPVKPNTGR